MKPMEIEIVDVDDEIQIDDVGIETDEGEIGH